MPNFEDILNKPMAEIKPPPVLPVGTYLVGIIATPENITSTQKQTPGVAFKYKFYQAGEDVDRTALDAVLTSADQRLTDVEMTDTFYVTDKSAFMLKQFITGPLEFPETVSLKQALSECSGKQLKVHIRHRPRQDGTGLYAEIDARIKAE